MRRLFPVVAPELTAFTCECAKRTFSGMVLLVGLWFLIDDLPRLATVVNEQSPVRVVHPPTSQPERLNYVTSPPEDSHGQH